MRKTQNGTLKGMLKLVIHFKVVSQHSCVETTKFTKDLS